MEMITRFRPLIALDYNQSLANGATYSTDPIPCIGYCLLYGMIWTSKAISFSIEQGTNQKTMSYRDLDLYSLDAIECQKFEIKICGKFLRISLVNGSGSDADIEAFFCLRSME